METDSDENKYADPSSVEFRLWMAQQKRKKRKSIPLAEQVLSILNKYNATMLLPGVSGVLRFGYQPGNYRESTGQTLAAADQQIGLVVDAARVPGPELVTNGGFDTDLSGWHVGANVSAVQNSGEAVVTFAGSFLATGLNWFAAGPIVNTGDTRAFAISFDATWVSGSGSLQIGTGYVLAGTIAPNSSKTRYSVISRLGGGVGHPTNSGAAVFGATASGTTWRIDNVSVRELPGIHASQSTSGFQPVLRNTAGIQSWQFDGTDDRLSLSAVPFQISDDHFVIGGATVANFSALRALFGAYSSSQNNPRMQIYCAPTTGACIVQLRGDSGASVVPSAGNATANQPFVFGWEKQGSVVRALFDNAVSGNASTAPVGALTVDVAAIGETKGAFHNGMIHGVIFGKGVISASERQTLVKFMAQIQGRQL